MAEEIFIEVEDIIEEEDGGAVIILNLNEPARDFLIGEGIRSILTNKISNMEGLVDEKVTANRTCCSDVCCSDGDGHTG